MKNGSARQLRYNEGRAERWHRDDWTDEHCFWFLLHAMTLAAHYGNPSQFHPCCGLRDAMSVWPFDYVAIRVWMHLHRAQVDKATNYYVTDIAK